MGIEVVGVVIDNDFKGNPTETPAGFLLTERCNQMKIRIIVACIFIACAALYAVYLYGEFQGKDEGYDMGYVDGFFLLRPVSPNISPLERYSIQKRSPGIPKPTPKPSSKQQGILI